MIDPTLRRHGDLLIRAVPEIPSGLTKQADTILALGEATGHHHRLVNGQATVYADSNGKKYFEVAEEEGCELVHEEHKPIEIPKGNYEVVIEKEYEPFTEAIRTVAD